MSIQVPISPQELRKIRKHLRKQQDIVCCDKNVHVLHLLVAKDMLMMGKTVAAKIVKGYAD